MPVCKIGAVTMKITSSTSMTSTSGVTLISASAVCVRPRRLVKAIMIPLAAQFAHWRDSILLTAKFTLNQIEQAQAETIHLRREHFDTVEIVIVGEHRRHCRRDACRRRH